MSITQSFVQSQSLKISDAMCLSIKIMQMSSAELESFINKEISENPFLLEDDLSFNHFYVKNHEHDFDIDTLATEESLYDKLSHQIELLQFSPSERVIAYHMINYLNDNGYIECDFVATSVLLGCSVNQLENILKKLQSFEPCGIFARNLTECLTIQFAEKSVLTHSAKIILNNLELIAKKEISKLAKLANCSLEQTINIINLIKTLNPKPCAIYEKAYSVIPDVAISKSGDNFDITLNGKMKIEINKELYEKVKSQDKKFAQYYYARASNIVKSIEKREHTILKVSLAIFARQKRFFEIGIMGLIPMTLSEIAKDINMHESSVSRITSGKYMATHLGIFEMKKFFTSTLVNEHGTEISSSQIKELIKNIIAKESKTYSDSAIANELKKYHISAARRTVAKYREELKIPTSAQRKRNKEN